MEIKIRKTNQSGLSYYQIRKAALFYAHKLMSKRLADTLSITIKFDDSIGCCGMCTWMDDPYRPKEFLIAISPEFVGEPFLKTLAHEMVHVKQYARGELRDLLSKGMVAWKKEGEFVLTNSIEEAYEEQPWEKEAFGMELELFQEFISSSRKK